MNSLVSIRSPLSVNFELTLVCNMRCEFCFSNSAKHKHKHPPLDQVKKIIDILRDEQVFEIRWFGGEFTAYPYWKEAVAYAKERDFFSAFVSNGTLLNPESVKFLTENGISGGAISLHGTEDVHNKIVGQNAFQRVVRGIKECISQGIGITLLFTPEQLNFRDLYPLASWIVANHIEINEISVGRLCPSGEARDIWEERKLSLDDYLFLFAEMERIERDFGLLVQMGDAFPLCRIPRQYWDRVTGCWQGTGFAQICASGEVKSCSICSGSYGNILNQSLSDIWQNRLASFRSLEHLPMRCRICPFFCGGGCSATRVDAQLYAPDEFIANNDENVARDLLEFAPLYLGHKVRGVVHSLKHQTSGEKPKPVSLEAKPRINTEWRYRSESSGYIGFFEGMGILNLDDRALFIMKLLDGSKTLREISRSYQLLYATSESVAERQVSDFVQQINRGNFLSL